MLEDNVKLPGSLNAQGKIKIELMDAATGDLVDKSETNNFISKGMEALYQMQMKNLFQRGKFSGGRPVAAVGDPFRRMYLTDADHDADPDNEWLMQGKIIGTALTNTDLTEGGELAGQYNAVESFVTEKQVRVVIDFPATAANGTINSVYFVPDGGALTGVNGGFYKNLFGLSNVSINNANVYNGNLYVTVKDTVFIFDENLVEINRVDFELVSTADIDSVAIYNNSAYFIIEDTRNTNLYKIPLVDFLSSDGSISPNLSDRIMHGDRDARFRSVVYMGDRSQFALSRGNFVDVYDTDFQLLHSHDIGSNVGSIVYHNRLLVNGTGVIDIDRGIYIPLHKVSYFRGLTPDETMMIVSVGNIIPRYGISSRAKLSSPVVKTSTNIMKVTYDFILPSLYPEN